jgi:hypothetical protein
MRFKKLWMPSQTSTLRIVAMTGETTATSDVGLQLMIMSHAKKFKVIFVPLQLLLWIKCDMCVLVTFCGVSLKWDTFTNCVTQRFHFNMMFNVETYSYTLKLILFFICWLKLVRFTILPKYKLIKRCVDNLCSAEY